MTVEITNEGYFHSFDSEVLPRISWQEMLDRKIVFAPHIVDRALEEAESLLVTYPGPNLEKRKVLAPQWFSYWHGLLSGVDSGQAPSFISSGNKFVRFENLQSLLEQAYPNKNTGMLFVAGAEGHKGHVHAARYMGDVVPVTIWGFERPEYMERKIREAPFLPLELRLSMWFYNPDLTHITVLPGNTTETPENEHYDNLFVTSGAKYFFVHERDPHIEEKLRRGGQDLDRIISHPFGDLSTTDEVHQLMPELSLEQMGQLRKLTNLRIIPDMVTETTTKRVKRLLPKQDFTSRRQVLRVQPSIEEFFNDNLESSDYYDLTFCE